MGEFREIVDKELKANNIVVKRWRKNASGGAYKNREVIIPVPVDFETLGVCFHEIGHIALNHFEHKKRVYIEEFEAEQYAISKLKEYGKYNKIYEYRAIAYVLSKIAQAKNRGHNMRQVPKEIVKWTHLQINKWNKANKVYVSRQVQKNRSDIQIFFR